MEKKNLPLTTRTGANRDEPLVRYFFLSFEISGLREEGARQTHKFEFYLTKAQRNTKITKYLFDIFFLPQNL